MLISQQSFSQRASYLLEESDINEWFSDSSDPSAVLDWEHLHQLSDGSDEFELELLHLFVQDSQQYLEFLRKSITQQEFEDAEQAAHHLKGASANVGALKMQQIADDLEQRLKHGGLETLPELVIALEFAFRQIQNLL